MKRSIIILLIAILSITCFSQNVTAPEIDKNKLPQLQNTNVDIPWTELRQLLLSAMQRDTSMIQPPKDYLITSADYNIDVKNGSINGNSTFSIEILKKGYTEIQLFHISTPLRNPTINGKPAPLSDNGYNYTLILEGPKTYTFKTGFVLELKEHVSNFRLNIPRSPTNSLNISLPKNNLEVKVEPASILNETHTGVSTRIIAFMPATDYLFCEWIPKKAEKKEEEVEPVVYGESNLLFSVGEGLITGRALFNYNVVQGKKDVLKFRVPKELRVLNVSSSQIREWKIDKDSAGNVVSVYLKFPQGGNIQVSMSFETNMKAVSAIAKLPVIEIIDVDRQKGHIGVEARTNVEIKLDEKSLKTASRIDRSELPSQVWNLANHPIILAFKYLETPYIITLDVEKHEDLPVKVATADNAMFIVLLTRDGNYIVRGTYYVRNNLKQFLNLMLPEDATLWSLFVNNKPAKPGKGEKNHVLIPMEKSRGGENATTFPVELVFFVKGNKFGSFGSKEVLLPKVDIPVSELTMSLYLPYGYSYSGFRGTLEEADFSSPDGGSAPGILGRAASYEKVKSNIASNVERKMDLLEAQVAYEEEVVDAVQQFSATQKGVMPVKINIPEVGDLRRFQKMIIPEDEDAPFPNVKIRYTKENLRGIFTENGIRGILSFVFFFISIFAFWYLTGFILDFFNKLREKDVNLYKAALKPIALGFAEIIILTIFINLFNIGLWVIYVPFVLGTFIFLIYFLGKSISRKRKIRKEVTPKTKQEEKKPEEK